MGNATTFLPKALHAVLNLPPMDPAKAVFQAYIWKEMLALQVHFQDVWKRRMDSVLIAMQVKSFLKI